MQKYDYFLDPEKATARDGLVIHNVGFYQCPPDYTYGWDTRDYYLIHYCISGKGTFHCNGIEYEIDEHDGFLITPGNTIMHVSDHANPWNVGWIGFNGPHIENYLEQADLSELKPIFHYLKDDLLLNCITNLYDKIRNPQISILTLTSYLYTFLGALIDNHKQADETTISLNYFEKASRYIKHNIGTQLTVDLLAYEIGVSPSQLYRSFITHCGVSPKQYIDHEKMQKACSLMEKTDLSFHEISEFLGYEYDTHFYKTFKRIIGKRPTEYKENLV